MAGSDRRALVGATSSLTNTLISPPTSPEWSRGTRITWSVASSPGTLKLLPTECSGPPGLPPVSASVLPPPVLAARRRRLASLMLLLRVACKGRAAAGDAGAALGWRGTGGGVVAAAPACARSGRCQQGAVLLRGRPVCDWLTVCRLLSALFIGPRERWWTLVGAQLQQATKKQQQHSSATQHMPRHLQATQRKTHLVLRHAQACNLCSLITPNHTHSPALPAVCLEVDKDRIRWSCCLLACLLACLLKKRSMRQCECLCG